MNGFSNPYVSTAAAQVRHILVDILIGGVGEFLQEIGRCHDLASLAVTTLGYVELKPRLLNRVIARPGQSFDGRNVVILNRVDGRDATSSCLPIDVHCTGTTLTDATSKLCSGHFEMVAQYPE